MDTNVNYFYSNFIHGIQRVFLFISCDSNITTRYFVILPIIDLFSFRDYNHPRKKRINKHAFVLLVHVKRIRMSRSKFKKEKDTCTCKATGSVMSNEKYPLTKL